MCSIRRNIAVFVTDFLRSLKMNYSPTRAERAVQTPIAPRSQHPIAVETFAIAFIANTDSTNNVVYGTTHCTKQAFLGDQQVRNMQNMQKKYAKKYMQKNMPKYAQYQKKYMHNMQNMCKTYAQYARNKQEICKICAQYAKICSTCKKYARNMRDICKSMQNYAKICKICKNVCTICK